MTQTRAISGDAARPPQTANLRMRAEKITITRIANINAASAFLVLDKIIDARPNTSSSRYHALFLARPNTGSNRHTAIIERTAPDVPTLFEASTGSTPVRRPPSIASVGQIGRLAHTP